MSEGKKRVYCSGPLFNDMERDEMAAIAKALEEAGYETFLPHRDGFEFQPIAGMLEAGGMDADKAGELWAKAIFALDAWQVLVGCDALVVNFNGRVPDEGAVAEASMAWTAGKVVAAYKEDVRSLVMGQDNHMITGLVDFRVSGSIRMAVNAITEGFDNQTTAPSAASPAGQKYLALGEKLWTAFQSPEGIMAVLEVLKVL